MNRRQLLKSTCCGFGGIALADIVRASSGILTSQDHGIIRRAKRVIFLFMSGGPSQQDLFDPKDYIIKHHGQQIDSPLKKEVVQVGTEKFLALAPMSPIRPRGQSGMMISDLMPHLASIADDICLIKGMVADNPQHAGARLQFQTGSFTEVRPSMGSWIGYALGSDNDNLPSFVTIEGQEVREFGSAFLPAIYQGTKISVPKNKNTLPIENLKNISSTEEIQSKRIDFINKLNQKLNTEIGSDQNMEGMIKNMELAARMQLSTPKITDISQESQHTLDLYGIGQKETDSFGRACLLARKFSESGVRFVQVTSDGWDHHDNIRANLPRMCSQTDKPVAALIKDLKARGMLEDTLVIWSGEFGRTPWSQDLSNTSPIEKHGREHQPEGFCSWMAGAGIKGGFTYGETDYMGYKVENGKMHIHDFHATLLYLLGIDHTKLTAKHLGRDFRLTDVYGEVIKDILS